MFAASRTSSMLRCEILKSPSPIVPGYSSLLQTFPGYLVMRVGVMLP
jgi:hypothetical protein